MKNNEVYVTLMKYFQNIADQVNQKKCEICNKSLKAKPFTIIHSTNIPNIINLEFDVEFCYCDHDEFNERTRNFIIQQIKKIKGSKKLI